jgi:hypothetical protein
MSGSTNGGSIIGSSMGGSSMGGSSIGGSLGGGVVGGSYGGQPTKTPRGQRRHSIIGEQPAQEQATKSGSRLRRLSLSLRQIPTSHRSSMDRQSHGMRRGGKVDETHP